MDNILFGIEGTTNLVIENDPTTYQHHCNCPFCLIEKKETKTVQLPLQAEMNMDQDECQCKSCQGGKANSKGSKDQAINILLQKKAIQLEDLRGWMGY